MDAAANGHSSSSKKEARPSSHPAGSSGLDTIPMDVDSIDVASANLMASSSAASNSALPPASSRTYSTARLRSFTGYLLTPPVDVGLDFRLPAFKNYCARVVKIGSTQYLIWSPNSLQDPYYPGPYALPGQMYQKRRPWLGFILRESLAAASNVEYTPVYSVWCDSPQNENEGYLPASYVDQLEIRNREMDVEIELLRPRLEEYPNEFIFNRPTLPTVSQVAKLREIVLYEKAIDSLTEVQRGMREKGAWLTMMTALVRETARPRIPDDVLPADDRFLGVWINDAEKDDLSDVEPEHESAVLDFLQRTDIQDFVLTPAEYQYDQIGLGPRYRYTTTEFDRVPHASIPSNPGLWSDLRLQLFFPPATRLPMNRPAVHPPRPLRTNSVGLLYAQQSCIAEEERQRVCEAQPRSAAGGTAPTNAKADTRVEHSGAVELDPARAPWLQAPSIREPSKGKWVTFREKTDGADRPYLQQLGKNNTERELEEGDVMFYDRERNRRLVFEGNPPLEGEGWLTMGREFGRPAPQWPYKGTGGQKLRESTWMYVKERPEPGDVGRLPTAPSMQQLPTLDGGLYEEADGEWARVDEPEHDSDAVSLGYVSGAEPGNTEGPIVPSTGMEVEAAALLPATPPPSSSMRVQNAAPSVPLPPNSLRPAAAPAAGWAHYTPYQPLTGPNSIPGCPVLAQSMPLPTGPRNPYANALASSSRRPMDSWIPQFGPASSRYPRGPPNQPVAATSHADNWRRDRQRSPPLRSRVVEQRSPSPVSRMRSKSSSKYSCSTGSKRTRTQRSESRSRSRSRTRRGRSRSPRASYRRRRSPSSSQRSSSPSRDRRYRHSPSYTPRRRSYSRSRSPPTKHYRRSPDREPELLRRMRESTSHPDLLTRLGLEQEAMPGNRVFQRFGVPLESRIGEPRLKARRTHRRKEKREAKEAAEREKQHVEEERIMQEAMLLDAASQPAPPPPPSEPYEELLYPHDLYE
ncbi:hypothetical protein B0H16DRAFT_1447180 [Mycena metata]|uniref:Uncharacterized protein n=1 Tax=Mycena metata TaxID=1033252 RepID=A0AAD7KD77_9AGAR|nr:hypothetical protein B0H16DRAFT_1447180 [Mycena metata]